MELLGVESLAVAVGIYLPVHISLPVLLGGVVRWIVTRSKSGDDEVRANRAERGVLAASGLIAGESLVGILLAVLVSAKVPLPTSPWLGNWASFVLFLLLALWLGWVARRVVTGSKSV
jgi:uncharacterized oligopeptide transporter (OPT) family protein